MIIRFATKTNSSGLQYQLKVDTATKEFQYGSHLFVSADVHQLTKKQLDEITDTFIANNYKRT